MPTWCSRSRLRAAAIAALLLLLVVSMLATGSTAPPPPANGGVGTPTVPTSNAGTGIMQPGGDAGGPPPPSGDALLPSTPPSDDSVQALAADDRPGGWTDWPGRAWSNAGADGGQDIPTGGGDDLDAPNGNGTGALMLGWPLDAGSPAFAGGGASGAQGSPGPGSSDCALNAGPANECVLQQLKDVMPETASLPLDALTDLMPTSISDAEDTPDTSDDPSRLRETAANVPEPPAWLLAAVALLVAAASAVAERQRRLGAPVR